MEAEDFFQESAGDDVLPFWNVPDLSEPTTWMNATLLFSIIASYSNRDRLRRCAYLSFIISTGVTLGDCLWNKLSTSVPPASSVS